MIKSTKQNIRNQYLKKRRQLTKEICNRSMQNVEKQWKKQYNIKEYKVLAGYIPIQNEISPRLILQYANSHHIKISLPCILKHSRLLEFRSWQPEQLLNNKTSIGIPQPFSNAEQVIPDIILVPLLAFDKHCMRLGYGKGYYDHTIQVLKQKNPKLYCVGLAYDEQLSDRALPIESHDQPLDSIITPTRVFTP